MISAGNSSTRISPEEIEKMWIYYKEIGDTETKNELLLHYTYLVKWVVRRMMPKLKNYNEYDDLVNSGVIGLIDAVDKFDLGHKVKFETYAVSRIRGGILDYMRSQDWAPPSLRKKINDIEDAYEVLENKFQTPPSDQTVAEVLDMPVTQVQKIMNQTHMFNIVSFEDSLSSGYAVEEIARTDDSSPENILLEKEKKAVLVDVIDSLSEKERLVITLYYYEGFLLKDIADILEVSESRVSQIHSKVLSKMRVRLQKNYT